MNPIEAFKKALFYVSGLCSSRTIDKPGAVIERLSDKDRRALQELKSSDIDGSKEPVEHLEYYVGNDYYLEQEHKKTMLEFDKKVLHVRPRSKKYDD